jgi:hypothetical protein
VLIFPTGLFLTGFRTKIVYKFLISTMLAVYLTHLFLLDLITLITFGEEPLIHISKKIMTGHSISSQQVNILCVCLCVCSAAEFNDTLQSYHATSYKHWSSLVSAFHRYYRFLGSKYKKSHTCHSCKVNMATTLEPLISFTLFFPEVLDYESTFRVYLLDCCCQSVWVCTLVNTYHKIT